MKLTVRETKKAIKNNQTVKFTLERNNARELTSNKKYYKRYVKAIVKTVKSFYPALDSSYIYRNNDNAEIKSITTVINYLFTHLNEFPNMTKDEFINHLNQQLNEDFKD